mgnify:CR=1 FL=1
MPRQVYILDNFSGGLCNFPDKSSLKKNELCVANDAFVGKYGSITSVGSFGILTFPGLFSAILTTDIYTTPGYGLFTFSADNHINTAATTQGTSSFIVLAGRIGTSSIGTSNGFVVMEDNGEIYTTGSSSYVSVGSATASYHPAFYYVDGALRISNGNINSTAIVTKWFGHIKRTHFNGILPGGTSDVYDGYYSFVATPAPPVDSFAGVSIYGNGDLGSGTTLLVKAGAFTYITTSFYNRYIAVLYFPSWALKITGSTDSNSVDTHASPFSWYTSLYYIFPPAGESFTVNLIETGSGTWTTSTYEIGVSFIYSDNQESIITTARHTGTSNVFKITIPNTGIEIKVLATSPYSPRISGGRVYIRNKTTVGKWQMLADIDLKNGARASFLEDFTSWVLIDAEKTTTGTATSGVYCISTFTSNGPNADTYESINGVDEGTTTMSVLFKTATIANRRAYIGGVKLGTEEYPDSIFKSKVNRFDTFTKEDRLDVAIGDGENVVAIESYADRILEFKEKTLYTINVSQPIEYVEFSHGFMGVIKPYHVKRTEFGVVWGNVHGVYLYNGETVIDLFIDNEDSSRRKIDIDTWRTFFSKNSVFGYDPINKQVFIIGNVSLGSNSDIYLFDFRTWSWTIGKNKILPDLHMTNVEVFVTGSTVSSTANYVPIIFDPANQEMLFYNHNGTTVSTVFNVETGQLDFDLPDIRKNVYKVYIQHKNSNGAITLKYRTNGTTDLYTFTTGLLSNATTWVYQTFVPSTLSQSHNIKTFGLQFSRSSGNVLRSFEIGKIAIIYKDKGAR